jgi:hypothetical protein
VYAQRAIHSLASRGDVLRRLDVEEMTRKAGPNSSATNQLIMSYVPVPRNIQEIQDKTMPFRALKNYNIFQRDVLKGREVTWAWDSESRPYEQALPLYHLSGFMPMI